MLSKNKAGLLGAAAVGAILLTLTLTSSKPSVADDKVSANSTDGAMYFNSHVQDSSFCSLEFVDGEITYPNIPNPAATCPDMFGWVSFLDAVKSDCLLYTSPSPRDA